MSENVQPASMTTRVSWRNSFRRRVAELRQREGQIFLVLALVIGALTGLAVVAFILLTERLGCGCIRSVALRGGAFCFL